MISLPKFNLPAGCGKIKVAFKRNWPTIGVGIGCVGVVAGTVMASKATLKLPDILEEHDKGLAIIDDLEKKPVEDGGLSVDAMRKAKTQRYLKTALDLGKLYGPAVAVEGASLALVMSSHVEMGKRQAALSAAYSTLAGSYDAYRERVRDILGEEPEKKAYLGVEDETYETEEVNPDTGRKRKKKETVPVLADPTDYSRFARCFCRYEQMPDGIDDLGSTQWQDDSEHNLFFLKCQRSLAERKLHIDGWLSLNDVYEMLGFQKTLEGQYVGWIDTPEHDRVVDFGIYNVFDRRNAVAVNCPQGYGPAIMLDFNIDPKTFFDVDPSIFHV